jgi:uncharacterized membrane protein
MSDLLYALTLGTALGCGVSAGALFAFSSFVMPALRRLPPEQGIAAMQSINVTAVTPVFMTALFGTGVACVALIVVALGELGESHAPYLLAGAALYLLGVLGVTMAYNVPRNNALERVDPMSATAAASWERYAAEWTAGNHVRAVTGIAAAAALTLALSVA